MERCAVKRKKQVKKEDRGRGGKGGVWREL